MRLGEPITEMPPPAIARDAFAFVLSGLAGLAGRCDTLDDFLRERLQAVTALRLAGRQSLLAAFTAYLAHPEPGDAALAHLARHFHLDPIETLAVRLAIAAEHDLLTGHLLSHLQQPLALSRPTIGLVAQAFAPESLPHAVHRLGQGNAVACGLLQLCGDDAPLPERQLRIPLPTALALQQVESGCSGTLWPGAAEIDANRHPVPLGPSAEARAAALARRIALGSASDAPAPAVIIRCGDPLEARAAASELCRQLGLQSSASHDLLPVLVHSEHVAGLAPWLVLNHLVPVFSQWLTPGERKTLPAIPGFTGSILMLSGPEGDFDPADSNPRVVLDWRLETPSVIERARLWSHAIDDSALAARLASDHRHAAGRIATLAARAREDLLSSEEIGATITYAGIRAVSRRGEGVGLGALAELIPDEVGDDALVVPHNLRQELESLVLRCRLREQFADSLGLSIQARYRPSVRALFVGPSGTGKTLAVAWLATHLGIPLFRVDLAAITSKYIGETEKNLSQLLARAEQSEVLLLFDEADSLFGKRTDIQDSNDRFANAQTNYLLQRMESYDGITILTSNGRARFDDAFSRRFDAILTFPPPGPEERRELWLAHLGPGHGITPAQLNLLAAVGELTGGQIRNAVLRAAVAAASAGSAVSPATARILFVHLLTGVGSEYRKLSRQLPNELKLAFSSA